MNSIDPNGGALVVISPNDTFGNGPGITLFKRTYPAGVKVTLEVAPTVDLSTFVRWEGCDASNGTECVVTMTAAKSVTALYVTPRYGLAVTISGTGTGSINSMSGGTSGTIACSEPPLSGVCSTTLPATPKLTLYATPGSDSVFGGWGNACGSCAGLSCQIMLDSGKSCTAIFALKPFVQSTGPVYFASLVKAYQQLSEEAPATLKTQAVELAEDVNIDRTIFLTLRGGYDPAFRSVSGYTTLNGKLTITQGSLIVDRVIVK